MSNQNQNDIITLIFLTLVGSGLYLLFNRQPTLQKKSRFSMDTPAMYKSRRYSRAQAILRLAPHTLGNSIISLN